MEIAVLPHSFQVLSSPPALSSNLLQISAVASPPARSTTSRDAVRTLRKCRLSRPRRRRLSPGGSDEDGFSGGGGDDGPIGGGGGGGGWNFDGSGWDDSSSSPADPAFDFVYEVVSWLLFANCLHFAYKKVVRLVSAELADQGRREVQMSMASVC